MVKYKQKCISCNNFVSNDLIIYNRCPDCNLIRTIGNMKSVHIPACIMKKLNLIDGDQIKFFEENNKIYIKKYIKGEQNAKNEF